MIRIETDRLIIREFERSDLEIFAQLTGDGEVMKYVGDSQPLTRAQTGRWIENSQRNYERFGYGTFAVTDRKGLIIGYCGLVPRPPRAAEIIYGFTTACWGRGYATEAARAVIDFAARATPLTHIIATVDPENTASIKIIEKLGMHFVKNEPDEHGLPTLHYEMVLNHRDTEIREQNK